MTSYTRPSSPGSPKRDTEGPPLSGPHCEGEGPVVPPQTFTASDGWLHRWKKRHGIRQLSIQGEVLSSRHIDTEPFKEELAEWMIEHNIGPE